MSALASAAPSPGVSNDVTYTAQGQDRYVRMYTHTYICMHTRIAHKWKVLEQHELQTLQHVVQTKMVEKVQGGHTQFKVCIKADYRKID